MLSIQRPFLRVASLIALLAAASSAVAAQDIRERQLTPDFDLETMQMPIEIVSIKLGGNEVRPGEKITADEHWLRKLSFTVKNISDQPISYINIGFKFPLPNGFVVASAVRYGVDPFIAALRKEPLPRGIDPGKTLDLVLTKQQYESFLYVLTQAGARLNFDTAPYFVMRVCFKNEPDVFWEHGYLMRRDPADEIKSDVIERYVLPAKKVQEHPRDQTSPTNRR